MLIYLVYTLCNIACQGLFPAAARTARRIAERVAAGLLVHTRVARTSRGTAVPAGADTTRGRTLTSPSFEIEAVNAVTTGPSIEYDSLC